jgi:hypothetical protein
MAKIRLVWACDDEATIYFDGVPVGHNTWWGELNDKTFEMKVPKEIRVEAKNTERGPAGFACFIEVDGKRYTQTDSSWLWDGKPVYIIPHDFNPWGTLGDYFRNNGAEWIWSSEAGSKGLVDFEITLIKTLAPPPIEWTPLVIGVGILLFGLIVIGVSELTKKR